MSCENGSRSQEKPSGAHPDHASAPISTRDAVFRLRPHKGDKDEY